MYKLYYSPGACSMAIRVVLNELGVAFEDERVLVSKGEGQKPEFLKINPRGQVPVLVDDGVIMREGAAILIHLMEKHKSPLLPSSGDARAAAIEGLCSANASMHPAYSRAFFINRSVQDAAVKEELFNLTFAQINKLWAEVDEQLGKTKYTCGDTLTAADILLTVIANWNGNFPGKITLGSNVKRLLKEVSSRPAYQQALKDEEVEYKAAA